MTIDTSTLNKGKGTCLGHICMLLKAGKLDYHLYRHLNQCHSPCLQHVPEENDTSKISL